ncbi:MAG TPA: pilin [Candidatus Magasanikbacteria bacterium]|nr:pilin [Candidatus Magasanikbacteria bacterium]
MSNFCFGKKLFTFLCFFTVVGCGVFYGISVKATAACICDVVKSGKVVGLGFSGAEEKDCSTSFGQLTDGSGILENCNWSGNVDEQLVGKCSCTNIDGSIAGEAPLTKSQCETQGTIVKKGVSYEGCVWGPVGVPAAPTCSWGSVVWGDWGVCKDNKQERVGTVTSTVAGCTPTGAKPATTESRSCVSAEEVGAAIGGVAGAIGGAIAGGAEAVGSVAESMLGSGTQAVSKGDCICTFVIDGEGCKNTNNISFSYGQNTIPVQSKVVAMIKGWDCPLVVLEELSKVVTDNKIPFLSTNNKNEITKASCEAVAESGKLTTGNRGWKMTCKAQPEEETKSKKTETGGVTRVDPEWPQDLARSLNRVGAPDIKTLIGQGIKVLVGLIGSVALVMFSYAGVMWMVSMDGDKKAKASKTLMWSSLGLIVIMASYAAVNFIFTMIK